MSASTSSYYGESSRVTQLQLGYNNSWRNISYNLSVARQRTVWERGRNFVSVSDGDYNNTGQQRYTETLVALGFSVPFDVGSTRSTVSLEMNRTSASRSGTLSVAGSSGDGRQFTWSAYTGIENYQQGGNAMTFCGSAQQTTSLGALRGSVAQGDNYRQFGIGAASTLVLHQGRVTLGPYASDTFALIHAPGVEGAMVRNGQEAMVDRFSYAILPSLAPYRYNTFTLNASIMNDETELQGGSQRVLPYAGAVAQVSFSTLQGRAVLIATQLEDGSFPPMGANVITAAGNSVGMVGQGGKSMPVLPKNAIPYKWYGARRLGSNVWSVTVCRHVAVTLSPILICPVSLGGRHDIAYHTLAGGAVVRVSNGLQRLCSGHQCHHFSAGSAQCGLYRDCLEWRM